MAVDKPPPPSYACADEAEARLAADKAEDLFGVAYLVKPWEAQGRRRDVRRPPQGAHGDRKLLDRLAEAELACGAQPQVTAAPHLQAECTHDRHLGGENRCPIYDRTQTDTDHVFVSQPYTQTCFWRPVEGGGRCEHLLESSVHRGSPFRYYSSPTPPCCPNTGAGHELDCPNRP